MISEQCRAGGRITRSCGICGVEFRGGSASARYCSDECRREVRLRDSRIWRDDHRDQLREGYRRQYAKNFELFRARKRAALAARPKPLTERVCRRCGVSFASRRFRGFCSKACQRQSWNEKRRPRRATVGLDAPRLCAICGEPFFGGLRQNVCSAVECQTARKRVETRLWCSANADRFREWAQGYRKANRERIQAHSRECYRSARAAVLWWREHIGPADERDLWTTLAAMREIENAK
jgi:hypothetical protein